MINWLKTSSDKHKIKNDKLENQFHIDPSHCSIECHNRCSTKREQFVSENYKQNKGLSITDSL